MACLTCQVAGKLIGLGFISMGTLLHVVFHPPQDWPTIFHMLASEFQRVARAIYSLFQASVSCLPISNGQSSISVY